MTQPATGIQFARHCAQPIDMIGVEVMGYRVTAKVEFGNEAHWKVVCVRCRRERITSGAYIRKTQAGGKGLAWCECGKHAWDTSPVEERLDVSPKNARVLVAVVAYERAFGRGVLRKDLVQFCEHDCQTLMLQRRGLILYTGHPAIITATPKTWKAMRPEEETAR